MLGGLQPQGRHTVDGPAAPAASTLFGPEAAIGFDPMQVNASLGLMAVTQDAYQQRQTVLASNASQAS